ncbi:MAG: hypothetical protein APF84_08375 [Gracilibacter sp. BRH_c7a]|nr:MAG: hypothetical protein APF84_08375 [Gracilibacter sp. BRH_c7a]
MKRVILGLLALLAGLVIYSLLFYPLGDPPATDNPVPPNSSKIDLAPDFSLTDLDGNTVNLSDYRGQKNVYLNFWASWCGPCKQEMPDIEAIHREYADKDLVILAVNVGENQNVVGKYIDNNGFSFSVLLDPDMKASRLYKVNSIPVSVFIDKEGKIRAQRVGLLTKDQMLSYIEKL